MRDWRRPIQVGWSGAGPYSLFVVCLLLASWLHAETAALCYDANCPQIRFAAGDVRNALTKRGLSTSEMPLSDLESSGYDTRIVLATQEEAVVVAAMRGAGQAPSSNLKLEGFSIRTASADGRTTHWVIGKDAAGGMYGGLELAEVIRCGGLNAVRAVDQNPYLSLRGIKFNCPLDERTPTYHNHDGDSQQKNVLVMWDMAFWKTYLDALARFRYNCLSLWNLHPFPSMVRVPGYEEVALDDVRSTKGTLEMTMDQKIAFWREVMRYGKDRNVDLYIVTWNIFVSGTEGRYGLTDKYDNPTTTDYFRKSVKQMFLTYPDLAGIGLTTGENMPGMSTVQKEAWAMATYGQGILDAAAAQPGRKITLIHRQHQTGAQDIARTFQPLFDNPDLTFLFSFKYAQAHAFSSTQQPFCKSFVKDIGNLKTIWTLRNDDNFYFRWGAPDFVRQFIRNIPHDVSLGYYYGSDGYIWGREFLSTEPDSPRQLEMDKHWYHWMLWGRLGYNPSLDNERLVQMLGVRFPQVPGRDLFTAWQEASMVYPVTTGFHWGDLDFKWYIEGCFSKPGPAETESGFHDINRFITLAPHPGTDYVAIPGYVEAVGAGRQPHGTTPIQVSQQLHGHADKALAILDRLPKVRDDKELRLTLGDIRAICYMGKYYAHKIRGATELALYRKNQDPSHQEAAIREMTRAAEYWDRYTAAARAQYTNPILLNRVGRCDWRALTAEVRKDVEIAGGSVPSSDR